jgi:hypothetical protein
VQHNLRSPVHASLALPAAIVAMIRSQQPMASASIRCAGHPRLEVRTFAASMGFADNPIINSTFEKSQWHFELNQEGQPTGKKLAGRRERLRLPAAQFCTNR